jgi:O-antigen ligase
LLHPNVLGGYLGLVLPIALAFALGRTRVPWLRPLAWVALVVGTMMLVLTLNRGSWIGFALAVPLVILLAAWRGYLSQPQAVALFILLGVCAAIVLLLPPVQERFVASDPRNVDFRLDINRSAMLMWNAYPWTGAGLNTFAEAVSDFDYRNVSLYKWPVHNIYLLWVSETGIVGAAGMVAFLVWAVVRVIRATAVEQGAAALLAIGFAGGILALFVGELASFATRFDSVSQAFYILVGMCVALGRTSLGTRRGAGASW